MKIDLDKGCHQRQEVDYDEALNLIIMLKSIMILFPVVVHYDYKM